MAVARIDVIMPQMGESIAEGTVSKWLKKVGDPIKRDEPIFEISTDKVDAEIPSPSAGTLAEILVTEGQTVPVQTVVARLETEVGAVVAAPAAAPVAAPVPAGVGASAGIPVAATASAAASPAPAVPARPTPAVPAASSRAPSTPAVAGNGRTLEERLRTKSSPLVRKIAAEHGIELGTLTGSGLAGRVTKRDIEALLESGAAVAGGTRGAGVAPVTVAPAAPRPVHVGGGDGGPSLPLPEAWPGDVVEPMTKMRQLISDHMVVSRRTSAHVTSVFEVDLTRVARIRSKKQAEFLASSGQRLSYLPFIIRAVVDGLKAFPALNASVAGGNVIYRKQYNIGIAVALDWGLIVPVIKHADDLSLVGVTRALNDLASRARSKRLQPEEVQDGTFTITNPGVFGSLLGTPIINQPQVAIMGVGAIEKRPKVITGADGEDTIAIRTCSYFSISFDHRLIDGAVADEFLAFVKKRLETFPEDAS
jgi:pyruvate dehydrogenase E2 component (dihydrolipoamide acetyltransferase)